MKATLAFVAFTLLMPSAASAQDGRINLELLDKLAARASEKQQVDLGPEMLGSVQSFVPPGPKSDAAKQVLSEAEGHLRSQLRIRRPEGLLDGRHQHAAQTAADAWLGEDHLERGKGQGGDWELQEIYFFQPGGKTNGIFILNAEPGEFSVVNIVGPIDFAELAALGGILGIPNNIANSVR